MGEEKERQDGVIPELKARGNKRDSYILGIVTSRKKGGKGQISKTPGSKGLNLGTKSGRRQGGFHHD